MVVSFTRPSFQLITSRMITMGTGEDTIPSTTKAKDRFFRNRCLHPVFISLSLSLCSWEKLVTVCAVGSAHSLPLKFRHPGRYP